MPIPSELFQAVMLRNSICDSDISWHNFILLVANIRVVLHTGHDTFTRSSRVNVAPFSLLFK
jgi:hypothetical protein